MRNAFRAALAVAGAAMLMSVPAAAAGTERPPCSLSGGSPNFSVQRTRSIVRAAEAVVRARAVGSVPAPATARDPSHSYLRRGDLGETDPYWTPLAPTSDQVRGRDDPWTAWVRREIANRRR